MKAFPEAMTHGPLLRVCEGVHCVRGAFRMKPGVVVGRTMTIVETADGLVVMNAVRMTDAGQAALDALGRVVHLVRLSDSHGVDEPYYLDRYGPTFWTLPGARVRGLGEGRTLGPDGPVPGGVVVDLAEARAWREAAYLVPQGGGTLVTCDVVQNWADGEHASLLGRVAATALGFRGGVIVPARWRRFQKIAGAEVQRTLDALTDLTFENLVTGHGPPVAGGADRLVRAAVLRASA